MPAQQRTDGTPTQDQIGVGAGCGHCLADSGKIVAHPDDGVFGRFEASPVDHRLAVLRGSGVGLGIPRQFPELEAASVTICW
ncbi:hypothetical protein [Aldersonia kunmingensis]|uniref:hypothetical protein n=1 Tax=Aldersonia kunmingensis TaxID=408066 RepID=UPI000832B977|nr:hypothetical protein [Aldersonia kunmingensis]